MPESAMQLARGWFDAFRRRDLDWLLEHIDPEVEFRSLVLEMEGTYRGHEGFRAWWADAWTAFPDWNPEVVEARDLGDRILVHVRLGVTGASSGVHVDDDIWQVVEARDGLIQRWAFYRTETEALASSGSGH